MKIHTASILYLKYLSGATTRFDLDRNPTGQVTAEQCKQALDVLPERFRKTAEQRKAELQEKETHAKLLQLAEKFKARTWFSIWDDRAILNEKQDDSVMISDQKVTAHGLMRKLFALMAGLFLLVVGFLFSVVIFSVIAFAGAALWIYFLWKTRLLRKFSKAHSADARVFDGEAVVIDDIEPVRAVEITERQDKQ